MVAPEDHVRRISGHLNIAFVRRMCDQFGYEDKLLPQHVLWGFPLKGEGPDKFLPLSHVFPLKEKYVFEGRNEPVECEESEFRSEARLRCSLHQGAPYSNGLLDIRFLKGDSPRETHKKKTAF